ncbi:type II toxin-antitoxin system Phd/YefM family antitoxin [Nocardioides jensenii]|uniref:type II toxin-antitoxin system Phd/YefM family antitoxin n=1 Tax=Nocardioides jensenii TaxID=1843 RepID=UPI000B02688D|nr:type II toxin-antitoxin system prevent-host-death family antitoxin [Nocardioides jensenii]
MERIPHRQLRNQSAEVLRRVAGGESFEITNHGEVVAVLRPPTSDDLWESEIIKPATAVEPWTQIERHQISRPSQEILDELREDRL